MDVGKLLTLAFEKNVGMADRILRGLTGAALVVGAWYFDVPMWARATITVLGLMWTATGVLSKCSIYYALGYSTCPHAPRGVRDAND